MHNSIDKEIKKINMICRYCNQECVRAGRQPGTGRQRYYCKRCIKYQQANYIYKAYNKGINDRICQYHKESCGIRSISRIIRISASTVMKRIKAISRSIKKPIIKKGMEYEMDELRTYVKKKTNRYWVVYAIRRDTKEVIDFKIGKRNIKSLKVVAETLKLSEAKKVYTDGYKAYEALIHLART